MVSREEAIRNGHLTPTIPLPQTARTTRLAANLIKFNSFARKFITFFVVRMKPQQVHRSDSIRSVSSCSRSSNRIRMSAFSYWQASTFLAHMNTVPTV
jgi:hypothetical protein